MDSDIKKVLTQKGYKFLGHGQDQDAYLAPDGTILKIFGFEEGATGLSKGQQSFIDFANFCMDNPDNPFLPQFGGWDQFDFKGQRYLQIKSERLFPADKGKISYVGNRLEDLVDDIVDEGPQKGVEYFLQWGTDDDELYKETGAVVTLLGGKENLKLFAKTVAQLSQIARKKGYRLDLHSGNFMLGSDGEIVINDPFFTGSWR